MKQEPRDSMNMIRKTQAEPVSNRIGAAVKVGRRLLNEYHEDDCDQRHVKMFDALLELCRAQADKGANDLSYYQFTREEIAAQMGDTGDLDLAGNFRSWWPELDRWQTNAVNGRLKDIAGDLRVQFVPQFDRLNSKGGRGHKAKYQIQAVALDDATSAPPDRPPGCIRYQRDSEQIITAGSRSSARRLAAPNCSLG